MKLKVRLVGIAFYIFIVLISCAKQDNFPVLKGPYLGQKPPGMTPEIFAPGVVSTGFDERTVAFTPDGKELYFVLWGAPHGVILCMKEVNGRWTKPEVAPFSGRYQGDFTMSGDGNRIVFSSNGPFSRDGKPQDQHYCWIVERTGNGWGNLHPFGPAINSPESFAGCPTIADNGNLYFFSDRSGSIGSEDIWMSSFVNGKYEEPRNLGNSINTEDFELDPFIAPDESYLIVTRIDKKRERGADLFIAFRRGDGTWTRAANMREGINSEDMEYCPTVSPDGKYFFFTSTRKLYRPYSEIPLSYEKKLEILKSPGNGSADIYWVDAKIIDEFKPK